MSRYSQFRLHLNLLLTFLLQSSSSLITKQLTPVLEITTSRSLSISFGSLILRESIQVQLSTENFLLLVVISIFSKIVSVVLSGVSTVLIICFVEEEFDPFLSLKESWMSSKGFTASQRFDSDHTAPFAEIEISKGFFFTSSSQQPRASSRGDFHSLISKSKSASSKLNQHSF